MTAVVIGDSDDVGAATVVRAMAASSTAAVLVHPEQLSLACWEHTISPAGSVTTRIELRDGRRLADDEVAAVLCRSFSLPAPRFARSGQADRDYAGAELRALAVSWLHGLGGRVVNAVDGVSMTGPSWSPRRAQFEAQRAGLPVAATLTATSGRLLPGFTGSPYAAGMPAEDRPADLGLGDPAGEVLVAGREVFGALANRFGAGCVALAARARCRVLEVGFCHVAGRLAVSHVSPVPTLRYQWQAEVLARLLASGSSEAAALPAGALR
jgi:hypothetical protein